MKFFNILLPLLFSFVLVSCADNPSDNDESSSNNEANSSELVDEVNESNEEQNNTYELDEASWRLIPTEDSTAESQVVLMTFDDAPDNYATDMAQTLHDHNVPAIFFVNGMFIESDEGKNQLKEIHELGFEIGNHTQTHQNLQTISEEEQREEIVQTSDLVEEIIGERPRFFRAPFGANTDYSKQVAQEENMLVMNWSYGYDWEPDYTEPSALADIMVNTEYLSDGANLLMHDREWTKDALEDIILGLEEKGYGFVNPNNIESGNSNDN